MTRASTSQEVASATTPGTAAQITRLGRRPKMTMLIHAERYALVALLAAVALFFCLLPASSDTFPTTANLRILSANQAVTLLLALGVMLPLVAGHFDFSVGAVAATSSVVVAGMMQDHRMPLAVCIPIALLIGMSVGLVNGIAVAILEMNSFVATLAVATLLGGLIQWFTGGQAISNNISPALIRFGSTTWIGIPRPIFVVATMTVVVWYLLTHTPFGRSLYALGENARAARLVGIRTTRYTIASFTGSGLLAGIAGLILTARTGGATADSGTSMLFPALAAVFLGATAIAPGRFNVWGTVFGVALVSVSVSGLTLAGATDWVNPVFNGAALAVAVGLSSMLRRRAASQPV